MNISIIYVALIIASFLSAPQNLPEKGVPLLENYTPVEYGKQGKAWGIDSAPNGIVYMATDDGLVEYDGESWNNFPGSEGITRSVLVKSDSVIYTGSDLDFGVWKRDDYQNFIYTSLYPFKEELNEISEEFWGTYEVGDQIAFVSARNIYVYSEENLTKIPAPGIILNSFVSKNDLYLSIENDGLYRLTDLAPERVFSYDGFQNLEIIGIFEDESDTVFVSKAEGLLRYQSGDLNVINTQLSRDLRAANVFSFEKVTDNHLAFGTVLNGLYISDTEGNIIHFIDKNKGLLNNTILSLHQSTNGKLWMGLDFGITELDLSSEFSFFYDNRGDFGTGYAALIVDDMFYLGTNQGLYKIEWESLDNSSEYIDFELIPGSEGQVWTLREVDGSIWVGHDRGLFVLKDGELRQLNDRRGVWTIQPYKEYLLAGTYNGVSVYEKQGGEWNYQKQIELILGSCNQILIQGESTIWVNIPNYGVITAELNEDLYPENREIFLSDQFNGTDHHLVIIDGALFVQTDAAYFEYDPTINEFSVVTQEVPDENVPDLVLSNSSSVILNKVYQFYPVYNGFALRNLMIQDNTQERPGEIVIREVQAFNNEEEVRYFEGATIPHNLNNLRIKAIIPNRDHIQYQYRIRGRSGWSDWNKDHTFSLVGLTPGTFLIEFRAKDPAGNMYNNTLELVISTPWYQTVYAYMIYFLMFLGLIYALYLWQRRSLDKLEKNLLNEQQLSLKEQEDKHRKALKEVEERNLRFERKQLKSELKNKTMELAAKAKENQEKNKLLKKMKEKVIQLEEHPESVKSRTGEMLKILDAYIESDDQTFELQMDQLHQDFIHEMKEKFPELTSNDLRLCAYIKMGFNSKEIADLLNIKPSSIYISRSRLRKKLDLDSDDDLHGFINSVLG